MKERIQKLLARAGYGSRREVERWIESGEILVNGQPATIGQQIGENDRVVLRGNSLHLESRLHAAPQVLVYYKKSGEVCTRSDPEGRPTVFDGLPRLRQGRWVMIGRLDVTTDGLLLFTTDGELANRLMHPSSGVEREYASRILGEVDEDMLHRLQTGVELEDGPAHFLSVHDAGGEGANHWYHVVLAEGRNREVRRLWESQGVRVSRLIRVRYGSVSLPRHLRGGQHEMLDEKALRRLYELVGLAYEDGSAQEPPEAGGRARFGMAARGRAGAARPVRVSRASVGGNDERPARPARVSRASVGGNDERPARPARVSRASVGGNDERPARRVSRASAGGNDERPARPARVSRASVGSSDERPTRPVARASAGGVRTNQSPPPRPGSKPTSRPAGNRPRPGRSGR